MMAAMKMNAFGRRPARRARARGQVLPVMAMFIGILAVVSLFFFNTIGFGSIAAKAMEGTLRQAGLAGLQNICTPLSSSCTPNYARWELDGPAATATIRRYAIFTLVGMPEGSPASPGGFSNYFTSSNLIATLSSNSGTSGGSADGLDVELLIPIQANDGQVAERYFNCDPTASVCDNAPMALDITCAGNGMYSSLAEACFNQTTIVTRLRLTVTQAGPPAVFTRLNITGAGTDAP
jgi:hypothetical protein